MKIKYLTILILLSALSYSQQLTETEKTILQAQDNRDVSTINRLYKEGTINNDKLYEKALIALANIADTNYESVKLIMDIYSKQEELHYRQSNEEILSLAAFSLGQVPCLSSVDFLRMIEEKEENEYSLSRTRIVTSTLNALGKTGYENDLERICLIESSNDSINGSIALSIARFGLRKIKSPSAFDKLRKLTYSIQDENQLRWVAYSFNRIGDKDLFRDCYKELEFLAAKKNVYCRMWAISALGKTGNGDYAGLIMKMYQEENDWRGKVNMINAVGNLDIPSSNLNEDDFDLILNAAADDPNPNVSVTACQALAKICTKLGKTHKFTAKLRDFFEHYISPGRAIDDFIQNEMITTLAKIFKDNYRESLFSLFSQAEGYDRKSAIVSAFQFMDDPLVYKELRDTISADVMRYNKIHPNKDGSMIGSPDLAKMYKAFVEALAGLDDKMDDENKNITRLIFSEFSASKNTAITDICLSSLTEEVYSKYWGETGQVMVFDYSSFELTKDKDVMLLFIESWGKMKSAAAKDILLKQLKSPDYDIAKSSADALKQITGNDYIKDITARKVTNDFDWAFIDNLSSRKTAVLNTEKGVIKIELFPEIAPFTVESFVKLGEKGFYNGTVFHRIVPNFVIQGGDPTGSGYGGPGYSIRTEIADNTFEEYYVGMASSGKDTEGSQFFITHSPQPHLDGKYTIFGKVVEGFDAVDKIQIGDKILNVTFGN